MTFSKKYKYRSIVKKKTNKFFFFFNFFNFLFYSEFFFLIFQKKSNLFDFNTERKNFAKMGFIFKKTSSTYLRHIFKKYKPFFKGFTNLAFDFHFICYSKKKEGLEEAKKFADILKKKEMLDKYQILLFFNKGRFYTNYMLENKMFNYNSISEQKNTILFKCVKYLINDIKKMYIFYFLSKYLYNKNG